MRYLRALIFKAKGKWLAQRDSWSETELNQLREEVRRYESDLRELAKT